MFADDTNAFCHTIL